MSLLVSELIVVSSLTLYSSASCCHSVSHSRDHQRCGGGPAGHRGVSRAAEWHGRATGHHRQRGAGGRPAHPSVVCIYGHVWENQARINTQAFLCKQSKVINIAILKMACRGEIYLKISCNSLCRVRGNDLFIHRFSYVAHFSRLNRYGRLCNNIKS